MAPASSSGPPSLRKDSTPVIANVVSLASTPAAQPTVNSNNVLQGRTTEYDFSIFKSLFLDVYSCSGIFSTEDTAISSLCFTSIQKVVVLSFLSLRIIKDLNLFT